MKPEHVGVVILAAGRSERMKEFKALLPFDRKERFLERIISVYSGWGCKEIVVVTNQEMLKEIESRAGLGEKKGGTAKVENKGRLPGLVTLVLNDHIEFGRFYSVKLGLSAIRESEFCFIQNVDNPFVAKTILDLIYRNRNAEAYISPVFNTRGGHPVLLNRNQVELIAGWPLDDANLKEMLNTMECIKVEMPDDRVLININSPEEYKRYFTDHSAMSYS